MTLRSKFIAGLVSMVIVMGVISGSIALFSLDQLLSRSIEYIQRGYTNQWNRLLTSYYEEHGNWEDIQHYVFRVVEDPHQRDWGVSRENARIIVFDENFNILASLRRSDIGKNGEKLHNWESIKSKSQAIQAGNETVGYFWIGDSLISSRDFFFKALSSSIIRAMLIGLAVTFLAALILGIVMTRHVTSPLKKLTNAVKNVGEGNFSIRIKPEGSADVVSLGESFNNMAEQLAHNEEVRKNMVADIAHELRTPLTVISGKLESVQDGVLPATPENLLPIQDEVIRMTRLVRDLQQLSLAEAGKLQLIKQNVDIKEIIEKIIGHLTIAFSEKDIAVQMEGKSVPIEGDSDRLTQVFVNLIDNAIRHTPSGGKILISFTPEAIGQNAQFNHEEENAEGMSITIKDNGEGIPEDEIAHVFDRFYRVSDSRDRQSGGTGLGLAIAKEFIQAHGGKIRASSRIGEGTSFTIWLPEKNRAAGGETTL